MSKPNQYKNMMKLDVEKLHQICAERYLTLWRFMKLTGLNYRTIKRIYDSEEKGLDVRGLTLYKIAETLRISPNVITLGVQPYESESEKIS